ncbi:MAG: SIMPL domain-containing protein [Psychroflexus sp.]|nr:SIMPL domain-containing protein [Psychroflexus sp.]
MSLVSLTSFGQSKNFLDQPYLETKAQVDTLVTPDKITIKITIDEEDTKKKKTAEEQEQDMKRALESLNIDISKDLTLVDLSSDFKRYFLRGQKVLKTKTYNLIVHDAKTAGQVLVKLDQAEISNVNITKTEFTDRENLILQLKAKAVLKAKRNAEAMLEPLGQKVGSLLYVSDLQMRQNYLSGKVSGVQLRGMASDQSAAPEMLDIEFEKIKFTAEIFAKFSI